MGWSWSGAMTGAGAGAATGNPYLTAGGAILGGFLGGENDSNSATDQINAFNAAEAQKQRDWEEYMYKNRHQFEVTDLLAAGLNPVLSAKFGGGNVPTGAAAVAHSNPDVVKAQKLQAYSQVAATAKQIALMSAELKKMEAEAKLTETTNRRQEIAEDIDKKSKWAKIVGEYINPLSRAAGAAMGAFGLSKVAGIARSVKQYTPRISFGDR